MALVVPNPTVPANGQSLDATPLLANLNAVYQAIQSFDGSQIQNATIQAAAFAAGINPNTILKETLPALISSGLVWSTVSGLNGTMTAGTAYIPSATQSFRVSVLSVASNTFLASKDTYIDVDVNGNITYNAVTNGAAAPALTANSIRVAKVITSGAAITSIVQNGSDSLSNLIYPNGMSKITILRSDNGTNTQQPKSAILSGWTVVVPGASNVALSTVNFGTKFLALPIVLATYGGDAVSSTTYGSGQVNFQNSTVWAYAITASGFNLRVQGAGNWSAGNAVFAQWIAIGEVA